jgi:glycosyltransferase involved in cell wall biosynthesis
MLCICDAALCTSRVGADDLIAWLDANPKRRQMPLPIGLLHLGADFHAGASEGSVSPETLIAALNSARKRPTIVMVGSVEPRKAHAQVLTAFESLWKAGEDIGLIVVGQQGWKMEAFGSRLQRSPELGQRLHRLRRCSDAELRALYGAGAGLLMASRHEGLGLPVVEALHAGLPVLVRDLPVFREIADGQARYFSSDDPQELAATLRCWVADDFTPRPTRLASQTWDNCYNELCDIIFSNRWHETWRAGSRSIGPISRRATEMSPSSRQSWAD